LFIVIIELAADKRCIVCSKNCVETQSSGERDERLSVSSIPYV
jgi:hypothetical protein